MGCPHLKKKRLIGKHCLCTATNPEHEIQSTVFLNSICQKTEEQWKTCSYFTKKYKEIRLITTESEVGSESEIVMKYKKRARLITLHALRTNREIFVHKGF